LNLSHQQALPSTATAAEVSPSYADDLELAEAILARDRKATARLIELHSDAVHRYVWKRLTPRIDMVEDIVQEVFLAAWRALKTYNGSAPLRGWLLSVARHKVEDHYRRTLGRPLAALETEDEAVIPAPAFDLVSELDAAQQAERAAGILASLPYEYAIALRWRYWEDRPAKEMAALSGRTEKAVERLLARARTKFKSAWEEGQ
jgi:RNA polymerase sigma-70 factor (ECF subfamily)